MVDAARVRRARRLVFGVPGAAVAAARLARRDGAARRDSRAGDRDVRGRGRAPDARRQSRQRRAAGDRPHPGGVESLPLHRRHRGRHRRPGVPARRSGGLARSARVDRDHGGRRGLDSPCGVERRQRRGRTPLPDGGPPPLGAACRRLAVRADPGGRGHPAAVRGLAAGGLAQPAHARRRRAVPRAVRCAAGRGVLRTRLRGRYRAREFPLALARLPGPVAAGRLRAARVAARASRGDVGPAGGGLSRRECVLRGGVDAPGARTRRRIEMVSVELRRLGQTRRSRACGARSHAGGHRARGRQLQDRRRARLRARRSADPRARPSAQPASRPRAPARAVGPAARRDTGPGRTAGAGRRRRHRREIQRAARSLPDALRPLRQPAGHACGQCRPGRAAFRAVAYRIRCAGGRLRHAGSGAHRYACRRCAGTRCRRRARLGGQGRQRNRLGRGDTRRRTGRRGRVRATQRLGRGLSAEPGA